MTKDKNYVRSNQITGFDVTIGKKTKKMFQELREQKVIDNADLQNLADGLSQEFNVADVAVVYGGKEPHSVNQKGTLRSKTLGVYHYQNALNSDSVIRLYKYTAKKNKVRSSKGVLDTLLHEFAHHLDHVKLNLTRSLHTSGFYNRIGWLKNTLLEV